MTYIFFRSRILKIEGGRPRANAHKGGEMGGPSYLSLGASKKAPPSPSSSRRPGGRVKAGKEKEINLSAMLRQCPSAVEPNKISVVEKYITQVPSRSPRDHPRYPGASHVPGPSWPGRPRGSGGQLAGALHFSVGRCNQPHPSYKQHDHVQSLLADATPELSSLKYLPPPWQIDAVPDRFLDAEILFLSHNSLSTLAGFRQFRKLRVLSLA
jgi:hypothetical protein